MEVWKGWIAATDPAAKAAFTWEQWRAYQQQRLGDARRQHEEGTVFSDREVARLSFVRWLYETGRLDLGQRQPVSVRQS